MNSECLLGLSVVLLAGDEFDIVYSLDVAKSRAQEHAEVVRPTRFSK